MRQEFLYTQFGKDGPEVFRLGLSATRRPGKKTVYKAIDEGVNFFYAYGFDNQMITVLKDVFKSNREKYMITTGSIFLLGKYTNIRRTVEKRLKKLNTDYIDNFLLLGVMKEKHFSEKAREELLKIKEEGKVKNIGISCHDREFVGKLADEGDFSALMMRYNAAHRGAEEDIFPYLEEHDPGIISYTATRWGFLMRRPKNWPKDGRVPDASLCYRFVLSNQHVDVCLTAPSNIKQLEENLAGVKAGPLNEEDLGFMKKFGDAVHHAKSYFM